MNDDCRGSVWALRQLMESVKADLEQGRGDIKPVKRLWPKDEPKPDAENRREL